ncbi:laminin subunit alpha-2 [Ditylenchus destructor]|uniref:Laminin subunit alpha-2 n=1 Tax=Ditylenchus destructor TaxID=166010 RepID=A0AAD4ND04_9BILA|nr:laminin subunit alpha-2 [Ditylenchus destructor]
MSAGDTSAKDLLRALEDRAKEIETLKKELQKSEAERRLLETQKHNAESKQPPDFQMLLAQKRELQTQLEREESEKFELFSQINQLISNRSQDESTSSALKLQIQELNAENDELKKDFAKKEMSFRNVSDDLAKVKGEIERKERAHALEISRLSEELQDCQREIEVKEAALQSLNLAKPSQSGGDHRLLTENESLRQELEEKDDLLKELTESNDELGRSLTETGAKVDELTQQADFAQKELESLKGKLREAERIKLSSDAQIKELSTKFQKANELSDELSLKINELEKDNDNLRQSGGMAEDLATIVNLLSEAKTELSVRDGEIARLRQEAHNNRIELDHLMAELNRARNMTGEECDKCLTHEQNLQEAIHESDSLKKQLKLFESERNSESLVAQQLNESKLEQQRLTEQLRSKTERLNMVEELVQKLEGSLKLIETENSKSKRLETERIEHIRQLESQLEDSRLNQHSSALAKEALDKTAENNYTAEIDALKDELQKQRAFIEEKTSLEDRLQKRTDLLLRIATKINVSHENIKEPRDEDDILRALDNLFQKSQLLSLQLNEAESREQMIRQEMENMKAIHEEEQKSMRDEMIENVGRLSSLLESESKRRSAAEHEKENVIREKSQLQSEIEALKAELNASKLEKTEQQNQKIADSSSSSDDDASHSPFDDTAKEGQLKRKLSKLMDENARLAGDLLKQQSGAEHEFRKILQQEKQTWLVEKLDLEAKLQQAKNESESCKLRRDSLEPIPKPRKSTVNGGGEDGSPQNESADGTTVDKLRTDLDNSFLGHNILCSSQQFLSFNA